jgi:hypothetical protein
VGGGLDGGQHIRRAPPPTRLRADRPIGPLLAGALAPDRSRAPTLKTLRVAFEVASVLALVAAGGPLAEGVRAVVLVVVDMLGAVVVFVAVAFAVGILGQRQPPCPM